MATDGFATINNLRLHYLDHGAQSRPPLVCIHGLSGNAHSFDGIAPHFSALYHVVAIDVRGRGDSQWGQQDQYTIAAYVDDLTLLLEHLGFQRVSLIGTSMGGVIAMVWAGKNPRRIERVVLNDVGPQADPGGVTRIAAYFSHAPEEFRDMSEVVSYHRENYPAMAGLPDAVMTEWVKWSVKPTGHGTLNWKIDPAIRLMRADRAAQDLWEPYRRIDAPILIVRGAQSDILSPETARKMCQPPNAARVVEVPGVGHAPSLTEPAAMAALQEFLAR